MDYQTTKYMNYFKYILLVLAGAVSSCSLVDVMDELPPHALVPENVINDEKSTDKLLIGAYSEMRGRAYNDALVWAPSCAAGFFKEGVRDNMSFVGEQSFMGNEISASTTQTGHLWTGMSKTVNYVNYFEKALATTDNNTVTEEAKKRMLGEARFLRAHANLYLLTYFGYFWDMNSPLGIVLRKEASSTKDLSKERSSVKESYEFILEDLMYANEYAPEYELENNYRGSRLAAKALLARTHLYMGNFELAAKYAKEVMDNTDGVGLEGNYAEVFKKNLTAKEMIFGRKLDTEAKRYDNQKWSFQNAGLVLSDLAVQLLKDDPRYKLNTDSAIMEDYYTGEKKFYGMKTLKTWNDKAEFGTVFIRLAEMHLIYAEALIRSNQNLSEAADMINILRKRAGRTDLLSVTDQSTMKEELLNEIFHELSFEIGHEWYAMVRMNKVADFKPAITDPNRWVCAIPNAEISYNILARQNPYYIR